MLRWSHWNPLKRSQTPLAFPSNVALLYGATPAVTELRPLMSAPSAFASVPAPRYVLADAKEHMPMELVVTFPAGQFVLSAKGILVQAAGK